MIGSNSVNFNSSRLDLYILFSPLLCCGFVHLPDMFTAFSDIFVCNVNIFDEKLSPVILIPPQILILVQIDIRSRTSPNYMDQLLPICHDPLMNAAKLV